MAAPVAPDSAPLHDVLILGAGPAGLALGRELKQRGVSFLILERGATVAHSWQTMPTHLKLLSPWKANGLPGARADEFPANHEISRADYAAWLQAYARQQALPVQTDCHVAEVTRTPDGFFRVQTSDGEFLSRLLVNATGYFSHPFTPEIPGARASSVAQFHFANYRNADHLRQRLGKTSGLVLIVGQRLSAGQALVELTDAGFEIALSHRRPIQFGAGPVGWWIFFRIHPALEKLKLRLRGDAARGVEVRMPGGRARQFIESGRVKTFPGLARFEGRRVVFTDGRVLEPDAVLYATGFRPALAHLASLGLSLNEHTGQPARRGFESADAPGLFFLGLDGLRNFRSRFIRGLREDAPLLADVLVAHAGRDGRSAAFRPLQLPHDQQSSNTQQSSTLKRPEGRAPVPVRVPA